MAKELKVSEKMLIVLPDVVLSKIKDECPGQVVCGDELDYVSEFHFLHPSNEKPHEIYGVFKGVLGISCFITIYWTEDCDGISNILVEKMDKYAVQAFASYLNQSEKK